jgi:hypothetical protein
MVLAEIADAGGRDPSDHLRRAVDGATPLPEALGWLALLTHGDERCELARRYLRAAPRGLDNREVRGFRCPE